jgi:hypothetical protein
MSGVDGLSVLDRVLAEFRNGTAAMSLDELARRMRLPRDQVDAAVGYWVHSGELVAEQVAGCAAGSCTACPVARAGRSGTGCGGNAQRRGPLLHTIRPARP